ncbi:MAG: linear gramicidin synthase subunit [Rariglobus sp.]|nr:linear gramicidin synthase subunit [Rariglobus sp.]
MENGKLEMNRIAATSGHATTNSQATTCVHPIVNGIESARKTGRAAGAIADAAPLSSGQRRIWFLDQLAPGSPLHHLSELVRIRGPLDAMALESSLAALIERHEALRTTFSRQGNDPVQIVPEAWTFRLARTDLSALDPESRERELSRLAREEAVQPFDLRNDLLLRARLVHLEADRHALLLVLHEIAADRGSMGVLHRELGALYEAFSAGVISLLPDLPMQYAGHVRWQREHLHGETLQRLVKFWRNRLADAPPLLSIPSDHHRPPAPSRKGGVCTVLFPAKLLTQLHDFSRAQEVTLFETLLAAFKTLLYRYTGQEDIVVGTSLAGRSLPGTEGVIGHFVNTLVLRTRFEGDPTFLELLGRVYETTRTAFEHQELPFEKLVEELQPRRDLSHDPLCQVFFALEETPSAPLKLAGLQTSVEAVHAGTARTDLNVWAVEEPAGLRVGAEYSLDLFEHETIERMLGHFRTLLEAVVVARDVPVSRLPVLTRQEQARMSSEWNATAMEYPKDKYINQLFEEQVARTPDATALVFNDHELSYAELNRLADRLAGRLRDRGAGPDTVIALCAERSLEMVMGLLGILKAGATYVPLDPAFPEERLAFMLEDSGAAVLLTQRRLQTLFPGKTSVIFLDGENADDDRSVPRPDAAPPRTDNLAYILYTSGSTGRPKGVMVSHRNVINLFAGMDRAVGAEPGVLLAVTSISFDISVLELFWTLTRGFKVIILAEQAGLKTGGGRFHSSDVIRSLDEQIARHGVTHLQCTPSFARLLTRMPETLGALRPLRRLLVGGEALPADLAEVLSRSIDGDLMNMYGPTETTVYSTTHKVAGRSDAVYIGRPIANTETYILDRNRQPVPAGVPGELYLGGASPSPPRSSSARSRPSSANTPESRTVSWWRGPKTRRIHGWRPTSCPPRPGPPRPRSSGIS